jgi:hypothetical protein
LEVNVPQQIIGQALGIIGTILTFVSYQVKTKRPLLIIQSSATLCICISYLLLGATSGFALNIVCLTRNAIFYMQKERTRIAYVSAGILALVMIAVGFFSWEGWYSLLLIAALAANTVFISLGDNQLLRKSILVTSTMVLIYNIFVFSIGGITNEAVAIVSSIVGIIRFRKSKKARNAQRDI